MIKKRERWITRFGISFLVALLLAFCAVYGMEASDWPQFQTDEISSGQTYDDAPTKYPVLKWSQYTWNSGSEGIESPPIIAGNLTYVHAGNGLWAFDKKTGTEAWHQTVPGSATLQTSTPAYGNGTIFIATFDGYVRAYNATNGDPIWGYQISERLFQCPITYYDRHIYVGQGGSGGDYNSYFCLDMDGNVVWGYESETVGYLWSGASVAGDYLVFANHDAILTSVNRTSGIFVDAVNLYDLQPDAGKARASVSYQNGYVYTTSESGLNSGYVWKIGYDPATGLFDTESGWNNPIGFSTSTPVIYQGKVYVGEGEHGEDGSLICLDDMTGTIDWAYPVEGGVKSSPALSVQENGNFLYFPTSMNDGFLYCVRSDGALGWKWNPPDDDAYILQGATVSDGMVYLGTGSGNLYALGPQTGWPQFQNDQFNSGVTFDPGPVSNVTLAWKQYTAAQGSGIDTVPVIADEKVFTLSASGMVHSFSLSNGNLIWNRDLGTSAVFDLELATPCFTNGTLYVAKQDGEIWALDANDGQTVWGPVQLGSTTDQLNTPLTYGDGLLYIGSAYGNKSYYCLDASDGSIKWSRPGAHNAGYYWAGACIIDDFLVFGGDDGYLTSVNKDSGILVDEEYLATIDSGAGFIRSSVSYNSDTGRVYLSDQGGSCWAFDFDTNTGDLTYAWHTYIGVSNSTPAVFNGKVYVGSGDSFTPGSLYCLNETDGTIVWTFTPNSEGGIESSPVVSAYSDNPYIYFSDGVVWCVDVNGNPVFNSDERGCAEPGGSHILQGVAVSEGWLCFGNDAGYLYALTEKSWDVNEDGATDYLDMILIGNHYGETGTPDWIREDVNDDGEVNYLDMILIGNHYGE